MKSSCYMLIFSMIAGWEYGSDASWCNNNSDSAEANVSMVDKMAFYSNQIKIADQAIEQLKPTINVDNEWQVFKNEYVKPAEIDIELKFITMEAQSSTLLAMLSITNASLSMLTSSKPDEKHLKDVRATLDETNNKIQELNARIDYEMKRDFLKKFQKQ